jgi:hypothetical protein
MAISFPWGNEPATVKRANFDREWEDEKTLHPVGSLPDGDSPYGVKDMADNAREWVSDWYDADYYKHASDRNPQGPDKKGVVRSIRGGSWHSPLVDHHDPSERRGGFALQMPVPSVGSGGGFTTMARSCRGPRGAQHDDDDDVGHSSGYVDVSGTSGTVATSGRGSVAGRNETALWALSS